MSQPTETRLTFRTGLPPEDLEPVVVFLRTEVLLAQAETLGRLLRTADRERKLHWTLAVAWDSFALHRDSPLAVLTAAKVARIARQFDLAAKMLRAARTLKLDREFAVAVSVQEALLRRERDIDAHGSRDQMAQRLIIYACHHCGRLIEYISVPCMYCGGQPLTITEVAQSGRLATAWFSIWDLVGIGRQIQGGRKATEVVSNLTQSAEASMANQKYRSYVESALDEAKRKLADRFFYYLNVANCPNCGTSIPRHDPFVANCTKCHVKLRISPPMQLLNCLARTSIHFQHNFAGERTDEFDLFIRYLVALQSKLFTRQETPSSAERNRVLEFMGSLGKFRVVNNVGIVDMSNPRKLAVERSESYVGVDRSNDLLVLDDFKGTLQVLADWMFKTKALC
jgi:hypothetical protein